MSVKIVNTFNVFGVSDLRSEKFSNNISRSCKHNFEKIPFTITSVFVLYGISSLGVSRFFISQCPGGLSAM